ncbi:MAG: sulfatase [Planctomycetota bacterium]|nr:sulfatase [Planctomycetota bacterium]
MKRPTCLRISCCALLGVLAACAVPLDEPPRRPNIVLMIADDWSYPHAGFLGDPVVATPTFDALCAKGVCFSQAFVSAPSCSPARAAILAGQHHWRLAGAANLWGSMPRDTLLLTDILADQGYLIGKFGKGHWPSHHRHRKTLPLPAGHERFEKFLRRRPAGQPFFYWFGGQDPHRPYDTGIGQRSGLDPARVMVPTCLPDHPKVRSDLCDYYWEVQRFDRQCGRILQELERVGELDNTVVIMTSDNGMPFPRCKATLYDLGTRVPLVVAWGARVPGARRVTDFVGLQDLAPTILEACGVAVPAAMNARSMLPVLVSTATGRVDASRDHVLTGMEGHVEDNPQRAIRTDRYLLIRNYYEGAWPVHPDSEYNFNIDPSPTKTYMAGSRDTAGAGRLYQLAFEARPKLELYDLDRDPAQLVNVAQVEAYVETRKRLEGQLLGALLVSRDPRAFGRGSEFLSYRAADRAHKRAQQRK